VLQPYVRAELVQALPLANYQAISNYVQVQQLLDNRCTLLFVKQGCYRAYRIVPRTIDWADLTKPGANELVWLTQPDCSRLSVRSVGNATLVDTVTRYSVCLTPLP
jgi:hypothetical protein